MTRETRRTHLEPNAYDRRFMAGVHIALDDGESQTEPVADVVFRCKAEYFRIAAIEHRRAERWRRRFVWITVTPAVLLLSAVWIYGLLKWGGM